MSELTSFLDALVGTIQQEQAGVYDKNDHTLPRLCSGRIKNASGML